jgi:3-isopropylmalate dehydrogenase
MRLYVLPCDGIGPEITAAAVEVLEAADKRWSLGVSCDYDEVGFASLEKYGTTLRDQVLEKARTCDGIILGTQSHMDYPPPAKGGRNVSAGFRVGLDLYANVRPCRSRPFLDRGVRDMDLVIMREATEGFYADRNMFAGSGEFMPTPDVALSLRKITAHASERIARRAFELARKRRRKVTAVHKANNFLLTDGLFMKQVRKVAEEFPEVELTDVLVDAMAAHLVRDASRYDVIVTTNFYADILSDLASELAGGLGLGGSILAGDSLCCAQAQHGSAPDNAGRNVANPTAMILSTAMLIDWMGTKHKLSALNEAALAMAAAVDKALSDPGSRTRDLGGVMNCDAFGHRVAEFVAA